MRNFDFGRYIVGSAKAKKNMCVYGLPTDPVFSEKNKRVRCPALLDSPVVASYRKLGKISLSIVPVYKLTYLVVEVCISHSPLIKTPLF